MWQFLSRLRARTERRPADEHHLLANAELKRQLEALAASEERFRLLVDGTLDYALFLLDPGGHVTSWNPGAQRIKGYCAEEIIGRHFACFYLPEDARADKPGLALREAATHGRHDEEGWRLRKDGSRFWASVVITALHDAHGKLRGFSKITRDITERKQAEENARRLAEEAAARQAAVQQAEAIRQKHEELRVTLQSIGDGVIVTDVAGCVTMLNPVAEALTGWTSADAVGAELPRLFRIINEHTRQPVENPAARAQREGVIVGLANHTLLIARDGTERPIDDSAAPIRLADGTVAGVVLVFRDVTDRRRHEQAQQFLAEAGEVLGASLDHEQTLAALTRLTVPRLADWCSVWIRDDAGQPRLLAVAHADPAKAHWAREMSHRYPPDFAAAHGVGQVLRSGRPELFATVTDEVIQANVRDADHLAMIRAIGLASAMLVPLNARGRTLGVMSFAAAESGRQYGPDELALAEELTRRAALAMDNALLHRAAQDARRRAEEADHHKDEFLALLGHELRNPLAPIRNAVQLLMMQPDNPITVAKARDMIGRQAAQMTRLVDELLDASRIARGKVQLRPERLDLAALVRTTLADHRPQLDSAGLAVDADLPDSAVWIHGDATRLTQVIGNLLDNARKFSDHGGRVAVRLTREGERAVIAVADTGIGMPAAALPRLFEVFSQIDAGTDHSRGGLGLGLAVVKGLVELHGGSVCAHSDGPGRGCTFVVRLPIAAAAVTDPAHALRPPHAKRATRPLRVLVVDDNVDAADSLTLLLRADGHHVELAHDGPTALELAERSRPEVVFMDIGLPDGTDGYEVARRLRTQPGNESAVVIAVTGFGQERDVDKTRAAGFWTHLVKPVPFATVQELLALLAAG